MTSPTLPVLLGSSCLWLAAHCAAQQLALPSSAPIADGHMQTSLPFGKPGFRTQIVIDASAVATTVAVINGIRFRGDRGAVPLAANSVPNVTITLSHTSAAPGALNTTFANNVSGAGSVVFQGTVQLPAVSQQHAGPVDWDIVVPLTPFIFDTTMGNLLIDIVGNNAAGQPTNYYMDGMLPGGASTAFGEGPPLSSFDYPYLLATVNGSSSPPDLIPGSSIEFGVGTSFSTPPGVMGLGLSGPVSPIDLGPIGAPGNTLYIDPITFATLSWQGSFIGWNGIATVNVPNVPAMVGVVVYGQGALLDPSSNALGIVFTNAAEVRIGDTAALPMQQLDAADPNATTGTLLSSGWPAAMGAVPLLLEGTFF